MTSVYLFFFWPLSLSGSLSWKSALTSPGCSDRSQSGSTFRPFFFYQLSKSRNVISRIKGILQSCPNLLEVGSSWQKIWQTCKHIPAGGQMQTGSTWLKYIDLCYTSRTPGIFTASAVSWNFIFFLLWSHFHGCQGHKHLEQIRTDTKSLDNIVNW